MNGETIWYAHTILILQLHLNTPLQHVHGVSVPPSSHTISNLTSLSLSTRLYEHTSETQYLSTALLLAEFIKNHLYDGLIILDTIMLATCARTDLALSYNSGYAIDGFSSLAAVNSSYVPLYVLMIRIR